MKKPELLAPAGDLEKMKTAVIYGADAVYFGGEAFGLRAGAGNFTVEEMREGIKFCHEHGVRCYLTMNIYPHNEDVLPIEQYLLKIRNLGIDAFLVSDPGMFDIIKEVMADAEIHLSTQANTLNKYAVKFWEEQGVERVVVAREISLKEIKEISVFCPNMQIEAFAHGAMCISYSGRCLLSNYFNGRDANRGECVQACRWNYEIREKSKDGDFFPIEQDERGTYLLNSKDLNMISHIGDMVSSGVVSLKIEGRMKSEYYLATVINAYRRAIDEYYKIGDKYCENTMFYDELLKTNHRAFTTAYMLGDNFETVNYENSQSDGNAKFCALVLSDSVDGTFMAEMRNRFKEGDELEILSPGGNFNKKFVVSSMKDEDGNIVHDAKIVQQKLYIKCDLNLKAGDILRKQK